MLSLLRRLLARARLRRWMADHGVVDRPGRPLAVQGLVVADFNPMLHRYSRGAAHDMRDIARVAAVAPSVIEAVVADLSNPEMSFDARIDSASTHHDFLRIVRVLSEYDALRQSCAA